MENTLLLDKTHSWIDQKEKAKDKKGKIDSSVFGEKMSLTSRIFGCWHKNISRPFNSGKTSYRCCLECGARKQFDPKSLRTHGAFYFPPVVAQAQL
jgi:hypothetical protein